MKQFMLLISFLVFGFISFAFSSLASANEQIAQTPPSSSIQSLAEAINKAGRQRMLGQRIAKNYLMIGSEVKTIKAQKELDNAIALFEQQHLELIAFSPSNEINQALSEVSKLWQKYRLRALTDPDQANGQTLIAESDELFKASHHVVNLLEDFSGTAKAQLVNIAGKQRMLSQRIAKLYMAMHWRITTAQVEQDFLATIEQFEQGLDFLLAAPQNSRLIAQQLNKVKAQWDFSKAGFSQYQNGRFVPTVISVTTESMLKKMDGITLLYQQLEES